MGNGNDLRRDVRNQVASFGGPDSYNILDISYGPHGIVVTLRDTKNNRTSTAGYTCAQYDFSNLSRFRMEFLARQVL